MAQGFFTYSSATAGSKPTGATAKRNTTASDYTVQEVEGIGMVLQYLSSTPSVAKGLAYTGLESSGVTELYTLLRDFKSNPSSGRLVAFATDSPDTEYGVNLETNTHRVSIYKRVAGTYTSLQSRTISLSQNSYYHMLFRVTPGETTNTIQAKVWLEGTPEPVEWLVESQDNAVPTTTGWTGHIGFAQNQAVYYQYVGIGTNGDAAPREPINEPQPGATYLPDNLTVPELWYPGRKPTLPVKVNTLHPLTKGLRNILVLNPSFRNLGETPTYTRNLLDMPGGVGNSYDVFDDVRWMLGKSEYTICTGVVPRVVDGNNMIFGIGNSAIFQNTNTVAVWVDDDDAILNNVNCVSFQHSTNTTSRPNTRVVSESNTIFAGNYYNITCRQSATPGFADCWINGVQSGVAITGNLKSVSINTNEAFIGGLTNNINSAMNGEIHYLYIYDRALTDEETVSLNLNPYQFLVPA